MQVAREVVFESEHITVWFYPQLGLVHHQMHQRCCGAPFRNALTAGVTAMRQQGGTSWLSDDRLNGVLPDDDEKWATEVWFPQTKAAGWKYWAMVVPERAVGKLNVKRFIELYRKRAIVAQMFIDPAPAFEWLREQRLTDGA